MTRIAEWLSRRSGGPLHTCKLFLFATLFICANVWIAIWSANVATTWAQTVLIQADSNSKAAGSVTRWAATRAVVCDIAKRMNIPEQVCARR